jgi:proteinaceous RNase P
VEVNETSGAGEAVVRRDENGAPLAVVATQLRAVHLSAEDRASLLAGIGKLARERESADHFEGFVRWLKRRGPLPFLVDGANAGMYNQNFDNSGFNFDQVEKVMRRLRAPARAARDERVAAMRAAGRGKTTERVRGRAAERALCLRRRAGEDARGRRSDGGRDRARFET